MSILSMVVVVAASCAGARPPPRLRAAEPAPCDQVAFALPAVPAGFGAELVIAVNDEVCRREPLVPGTPAARGRLADWCPAIGPGGNRFEITVVAGACGRTRARAVIACAGPEPD